MCIADIWQGNNRIVGIQNKTYPRFLRMKLLDPRVVDPHKFMDSVTREIDLVFSGKSQQAARGKAFEYGFETLLMARGMEYRSQYGFGIPRLRIDFDYTNVVTSIFSLKLSLRERWKIFQYEAGLLKSSHGSQNIRFYAIHSGISNEKYHADDAHYKSMPDVDVVLRAESKILDRILTKAQYSPSDDIHVPTRE